MSGAQKTYRVYCFDGSTMTVSGDLIKASNDDEAIAAVQSRGLGSKCEVWEGDRLIGSFEDDRRRA